MTDPPSSSLHSHTAPFAQRIADLSTSPANHGLAADAPTVPEEQDYTIKCICGFAIEEQNTIYCEKCDTWQHTECYYINADGSVPNNEQLEDFEHLCVDCEPRSVDRKGATERQRARLEQLELNERRLKKPPSKSHKKKPRNSELNGVLTNGSVHSADPDSAHDRTSRSPRDNLLPSKRAKTGHRPSHSTNLPSFSPHASLNSHKRSASAIQSPTKVPLKNAANGHEKDLCSTTFVHLYDNDPGDTELQTNLLNDIEITKNLARWSNDIEALREAAPKWNFTEIFQRTEQPINSMKMPELHKEQEVREDVLVDGQHPKWKYLTVDLSLPKDSPVGEIKGKIGHLKEYTDNPANRWDYLRHPEPFVFFHKHLPIYIDTRSEGTTCRYLRRSCDPNLAMKTFLENDSEYHFCFVASRDIEPGAELTIGWTLDANMRRILDDQHNGVKEEIGAGQEEYMADWASKVLLEFGGCACNSARCSMAPHADRVHGSSKPKSRHSTSAPNTGYRINSRDESEHDDSRSVSESKSGSRGMTPIDGQAGDSAFGMEISAREKRKIAAMEQKSEKLEDKPAVKKKKRNSGGSSINTPSAGTSKQFGHNTTLNPYSQPNTPGLPHKPQYADASTSQRKSGSPVAKSFDSTVGHPRNSTTTTKGNKQQSTMPDPLPKKRGYRPNYVDASVQCEIEPRSHYWWLPENNPQVPPGTPFKKYLTPVQRNLRRAQKEREWRAQRLAELAASTQQAADQMDVNTSPPKSGPPQGQEDTEMQDASSTLSSIVTPAPSSDVSSLRPQEQCSSGEGNKPPPVWPKDSSTQPDHPAQANGVGVSDLHVDLPPKSSEEGSSTPLVETPNSTMAQSPLAHTTAAAPPQLLSSHSSNIAQPNPITKKLSLSEYFSKRKGSSNTGEKSTGGSPEMTQGAFKPPALGGVNGDKGIAMATDSSAIVVSPKKEVLDPIGEEAATQEQAT